jgi:hypothetical protein
MLRWVHEQVWFHLIKNILYCVIYSIGMMWRYNKEVISVCKFLLQNHWKDVVGIWYFIGKVVNDFKFCVSPKQPQDHMKLESHFINISQNHFTIQTISSGKNQWPSFLWYDMDRIENDAINNSSIVASMVVAALNLLSCCLATIGGYTYTQTDGRDLWSTPLRWAQVPWYTNQV